MTKEAILKAAIEKAVRNGWEGNNKYHAKSILAGIDAWGEYPPFETIVFRHDFAKAFFGTKEIEWEVECEPLDEQYSVFEPMHDKAWKHHLQQMVLEEDPILYLEKFL